MLIIVPVTGSILLVTLFLFYKMPGSTVLDSSLVETGSERELERSIWQNDLLVPFRNTRGFFYIGIRRGYIPDSLYLIPQIFHRPIIKLSREVKNRRVMNDYILWIHHESDLIKNNYNRILSSRQLVELLQAKTIQEVSEMMAATNIPEINYPDAWDQILHNETAIALPFLKFSWNGRQNLFNQYLKALTTGNPQLYTLSGEKVGNKFIRSFQWTLAYTLPVLLFGWLFTFGFVLQNYENDRLLRKVDRLTVLVFSFPTFVWASIFLILFTSHRFGWISRLFPFPVFLESDVNSWWDIYEHYWYHLLLPMVLFAITPIILFYRVFYEKLRDIKKNDPSYQYLKHLGLSEGQFRYSYLSKYMMVASLALLSNLFVAVAGGSLIIEWIFNIPGLGRYMYESIINYDISSILFLIVIFTLIQQLGHLVSDFLIDYFFSQEPDKQGLL